MMQPAESRVTNDTTGCYGTRSVVRCSLPQSKVRAVFMVVADVFSEQAFQMAFIHRNDVIQQITSAAFYPALRHTILPRAFEGGSDRPDLHGSNSSGNLKSVLPIPIKDQKPWSRPKRKRLPQLLDGPQARRMPGDIEGQDASTIVADDEETIEHAEGDR